MYIVEIEAGVWLAPWEGDPGRTLVRDSAKRFRLASSAFKALSKACEYRNFDNAKVIPVPSHTTASTPVCPKCNSELVEYIELRCTGKNCNFVCNNG